MKNIRLRVFCLLAALAIAASLLTGCGSKNAVNTVDFEAAASQRGFIIEDGSKFFGAYDYIKQATLVAPEDQAYQIEFYELNDSAFAKSFFESNKNRFIMMKGGEAEETNDSGSNYDIYKLENYGRFMMVERIDNTVIYVNSTDSSYKQAIEDFLSDINY